MSRALASGSRRALLAAALAWTASIALAQGMAEGEVRKVDAEQRKITLKHGGIRQFDMPPMNMVFQVRDPALLAKVKAGDKVRFSADRVNGVYTITAIEPAR